MENEIDRIRQYIRSTLISGLRIKGLRLGRIQRIAIMKHSQPFDQPNPTVLENCTFRGFRVEWSDDIDLIEGI